VHEMFGRLVAVANSQEAGSRGVAMRKLSRTGLWSRAFLEILCNDFTQNFTIN